MSNNIVLLGHGAGIKFTVESLLNKINSKYKVAAVFTHPYEDHIPDLEMGIKQKELYGDFFYNVFDITADYGIDLYESKDVNDQETIKKIEKYSPLYIISIGCRNIIKKFFLDTFPYRVLNIHTTPLPKYRGAASDSWMILNGLSGTKQFGCVHFINTGIDAGDIVAKSYYQIPKNAYPIDVFKARLSVYNELLLLALGNLESQDFKPEKQQISESSCFPRLKTAIHGRLMLNNLTGDEIVRFIHAFSYPFEGAHCFLEGQKINILEAEFVAEECFHPYAIGIIFGKNEEGEYKISIRGGYLLFKRIQIGGVDVAQKAILKMGKRIE